MKTNKPVKKSFEAEEPPQAEVEKELRYTVVIFHAFFGPDSDPPGHSYNWRVEPFEDYGDACDEAKAKAFESVLPGHTLIAYHEGEKQAGHRNEYEVLYELSDKESSITVCITTEYGDADFREWEE